MADPLLDPLNGEQSRVVKALHGPVLVLAGAGSGKTRALTHRIAYLIREQIARPGEILAVTFTNKAANEMRLRVKGLLSSGIAPQYIGTFHSLGVRLLRRHWRHTSRSSHFSILDSGDSQRVLKQALQAEGISPREASPAVLLHRISAAKNALITPADLAATSNSHFEETLARAYARYELLLKNSDAYDFDDLIIQAIALLEKNASVREQYQQRWRFLSVDEYQDTNPPQDRLLKLLLGPDKNICVVGDDYQAIYSWRGARVDHILQFEESFPDCTTIYLTQNYRSPPAILEAANAVIAKNETQKHKRLWTQARSKEMVHLAALPSDRHEAAWIRSYIQQHITNGGQLKDVAILYRTNAQSRLFEEQFLTHQLPYTIVGGFRFYERREIKDALALLQLFVNPKAAVALRRIAEALFRGVGPKTITRWQEEVTEKADSTFLTVLKQEQGRRPALVPLLRAFETAQRRSFATASHLLRYLLQHSGYMDRLKLEIGNEERLENINELLNVAALYRDATHFLHEVSLLTDTDTLSKTDDRITCMTLHAAKGLEFPIVFIAGCEEGLLPHLNAFRSTGALEEERRLFYVGITRAARRLLLSYAATRFIQGKIIPTLPSRFFKDLPQSVKTINDDIDFDLMSSPDYSTEDEFVFLASKIKG